MAATVVARNRRCVWRGCAPRVEKVILPMCLVRGYGSGAILYHMWATEQYFFHRRRQISTLRMHLRSSPSALQCLEVLHRTLALRVAQSHPSPSALSVATLDPLPPHESFSLRSAPPPITSSSALRVPRSSSCYAPFFFLPSFSTRACPKWDE